MKQFFNIERVYKFEWNDLRAATMVLNVLAIILFGYAAAYAGLLIAAVGIVKDFSNKGRHINDIVLHLSSVVLNTFFLTQI